MGTGNYRHPDGETVILDIYDDIHEEAGEDADLAMLLKKETFDEFMIEFGEIITPSFEVDCKTWRREERDCLVLAENDLYQIWSHEDSHEHVFLTYGISETCPEAMESLARANLSQRAADFFDRLQKLYEIRVATSPWTSAPRIAGRAAA